eukprot:Opistho-1_new@104183
MEWTASFRSLSASRSSRRRSALCAKRMHGANRRRRKAIARRDPLSVVALLLRARARASFFSTGALLRAPSLAALLMRRLDLRSRPRTVADVPCSMLSNIHIFLP